jgi:archaellum component FlaC
MTQTKELGKYEIVPTLEQLMAVVEYFEKNSTDMGRINFTQSQMLNNPIIANHFNSPSNLNAVNTYLSNEGFIAKVETGARHLKSTWDVSRLIKEWDKVLTREVVGISRPKRNSNGDIILPSNVEVEVVRNTEPAPAPAAVEKPVAEVKPPSSNDTDNTQVLNQLKEAMDEMVGYLQNLPVEMSGHLRSISNQLDLTDTNALENLQTEVGQLKAQKKDLEDEVQRLKTELEEVSSKTNYNTHQIYRQRNLILDEIDRMITGPSWTIRQNGVTIRNGIEQKLDNIMKEIGIETNN